MSLDWEEATELVGASGISIGAIRIFLFWLRKDRSEIRLRLDECAGVCPWGGRGITRISFTRRILVIFHLSSQGGWSETKKTYIPARLRLPTGMGLDFKLRRKVTL